MYAHYVAWSDEASLIITKYTHPCYGIHLFLCVCAIQIQYVLMNCLGFSAYIHGEVYAKIS